MYWCLKIDWFGFSSCYHIIADGWREKWDLKSKNRRAPDRKKPPCTGQKKSPCMQDRKTLQTYQVAWTGLGRNLAVLLLDLKDLSLPRQPVLSSRVLYVTYPYQTSRLASLPTSYVQLCAINHVLPRHDQPANGEEALDAHHSIRNIGTKVLQFPEIARHIQSPIVNASTTRLIQTFPIVIKWRDHWEVSRRNNVGVAEVRTVVNSSLIKWYEATRS